MSTVYSTTSAPAVDRYIMTYQTYDVIRLVAQAVGDATNCHYDGRQLVYWRLRLMLLTIS